MHRSDEQESELQCVQVVKGGNKVICGTQEGVILVSECNFATNRPIYLSLSSSLTMPCPSSDLLLGPMGRLQRQVSRPNRAGGLHVEG